MQQHHKMQQQQSKSKIMF